MDIVMIGSGNVAAVLGRKFTAAGHKIVQVISRNASAASELAYEWDTESANYKSLINKNADVYIIAVADKAIAEVVADLHLDGRVVVHTAASVPMDVLKNCSNHFGVFYPLQSLRKEMDHLPAIPFYIDGSDEYTRHTLQKLADTVSSSPAVTAGDDQRIKLHIGAVFVSNFVNHLYVLAEEFCRKEGIDFAQLLPLIEETTIRLREVAPREAQTGPALRHDRETLQKHLDILNKYPQLKNIYLLLTESIQQLK